MDLINGFGRASPGFDSDPSIGSDLEGGRYKEGGLDKPRVCRGLGKLCRSEGLRRSVALFTNMCFCHVLLFHYSDDLSIGLMRTLEVYERIHLCL